MTAGSRQRPKTRMIHVRLPDELHKRVRIKAAEADMTLQDWVSIAIKNELDRRKSKGIRNNLRSRTSSVKENLT